MKTWGRAAVFLVMVNVLDVKNVTKFLSSLNLKMTLQELKKEIGESFDEKFEMGLYEPNISKTSWTTVEEEVKEFIKEAIDRAVKEAFEATKMEKKMEEGFEGEDADVGFNAAVEEKEAKEKEYLKQ